MRYVYENGQRGVLNIDAPTTPDPALVKTIAEILVHGDLDAQAVALPLLSEVPADSAWTRSRESSTQCALYSTGSRA